MMVGPSDQGGSGGSGEICFNDKAHSVSWQTEFGLWEEEKSYGWLQDIWPELVEG